MRSTLIIIVTIGGLIVFGFMKRKVWNEDWCRKHAQKGDLEAMHSYYIAIGVKDEATVEEQRQALVWLKDAAAAGYEAAMWSLVLEYMSDPNDYNYNQARELCLQLITSSNIDLKVQAYMSLARINEHESFSDYEKDQKQDLSCLLKEEECLLAVLTLVQNNYHFLDNFVDACISLGNNYYAQYNQSGEFGYLVNSSYCYYLASCYDHPRSLSAKNYYNDSKYVPTSIELERWHENAQKMMFYAPYKT